MLETTRPFQKLEKADLFNKIFLIIQKLLYLNINLVTKCFKMYSVTGLHTAFPCFEVKKTKKTKGWARMIKLIESGVLRSASLFCGKTGIQL